MGKTVYLCRHGPSGKFTKLYGSRPNARLDNSKQKFKQTNVVFILFLQKNDSKLYNISII